MWQVFQNFPENNKDGLRMRFYLVLKFFVSTITWETWKNLKHFTVNQRFLWFYDFSVDLALWGYEKIKSSKEKKSVGLIFSFSVKYFLFKLDPSPLMPYLFIKFCKMWNVFNQISPATYHPSAFHSFFLVFFLLGNFYFLCRNVSVKPEFNEKSLQK